MPIILAKRLLAKGMLHLKNINAHLLRTSLLVHGRQLILKEAKE